MIISRDHFFLPRAQQVICLSNLHVILFSFSKPSVEEWCHLHESFVQGNNREFNRVLEIALSSDKSGRDYFILHVSAPFQFIKQMYVNQVQSLIKIKLLIALANMSGGNIVIRLSQAIPEKIYNEVKTVANLKVGIRM